MKKQLLLLLACIFLAQLSFAAPSSGHETCEDGEILWIKVGPPGDGDGDGVPDWAEGAAGDAYSDSGFTVNAGKQFAVVTKVRNNACANPADCPSDCPNTIRIQGFLWRHAIGSHCFSDPAEYKWIEIDTAKADSIKVYWENPLGFQDTGLTGLEQNFFQPFELIPGETAYMVEFWTMPDKACGVKAVGGDTGWNVDRDYVNGASGGEQWVAPDYPTNWFSVNNPPKNYIFYANSLVVKDDLGNVLVKAADWEYKLANNKTYSLSYSSENQGTADQSTRFVTNIFLENPPLVCTSLLSITDETEVLGQSQIKTVAYTYNPNADDPGNDCFSSTNGLFNFSSTAAGQNLVTSYYQAFDILGPTLEIRSMTPTQFYYDESDAEVDILVQVENDSADGFPPGTQLELRFKSLNPTFAEEYQENRLVDAPGAGQTLNTTFSFTMAKNSFGEHQLILEVYDGVALIERGLASFLHPHILTLTPDTVSADIGETVTASLNVKNDYHAPKTVDISSSNPGWISFDRQSVIVGAQKNTSSAGEEGDLTVSITPKCLGLNGSTETIDIIATGDLKDNVQLEVNVNNPEVCNPPVPAEFDFQIVSLELNPSAVFVEFGGNETVEAVVNVRKLGSGFDDAVTELDVVDFQGNSVLSAVLSDSRQVGQTPEEILFPVDVPDSWEPGIYAVHARIYNTEVPRNLHDSKIKYLTVGIKSAVPVPEIDFVFIPLLALSVLAVLFFADKRHSGKL